MALRAARVLEASPGRLRLQPLGLACGDCSSGCGGRCRLFGPDECVTLPLPAIALTGGADTPAAGDVVSLRVDDARLRRLAWLGYGRALLGLVLGAGLGHALGLWLAGPANLHALLGLLLGTSAAVVFSKSPLPAALELVAPAIPSPETKQYNEP